MGVLYVVGTPIGNLADISFRAIDVLRSVDTIFCEDTRITRRLLSHYDIGTHCVSYNSFSGFSKINKAIDILKKGKNIALVSDAGTPTISDPGVKFVRTVRETLGEDVSIQTIPGASALISALSISGAPSSSFVFFGFLPRKKGRQTIYKEISNEEKTVVFYESPHRLLKALIELSEYIDPDREVIVLREMTKIHEQIVSGNISEVLEYFSNNLDKVRGEIVIVISALTC